MPEEADDERLVQQAADGDREAFALLVERHQARVRLWIGRLISDREDAHDLAQEVFFAAWRGLPRFAPGARFLPWLRGIARHRIADHLRAHYRHRTGRHRQLDEALSQLAVEDPGEGRRLDEELAALRRCFDELPEDSRRLLRWRYRGGRSMAEIDAQLERGRGYAANRLLRLRRRLADCVRRRLPEMRS